MVVEIPEFEGTDSNQLLAVIGAWFNKFATKHLSFLPLSSVLPLTGFTILHSTRIAYLYHSILYSQGVSVGNRKSDVSFLQASLVCTTLVMSGTTMAAILQGQPSGLFSEGSGELVAAYSLAAVAMKWIRPFLDLLPQLPLKLFLFLVDGFATTFGTLSLGLIPVLRNPRMISSEGGPLVLPTLIVPLLCGSGASLLVPFFGLFQPRFSFGHPGFLSGKLSVDFWGPWFITLVYGTITDGRGLLFGSTRKLLSQLCSTVATEKVPKIEGPWMKADEAHVFCSLILSSLYIINEIGPNFINYINGTPAKGFLNRDKSSSATDEKTKIDDAASSAVETSLGKLTRRSKA
ncbi:hypothetical protein PPACK8108_LOCUS8938 [Phakopsora pachyrhizi]|uniref:Uncharacterized protein n=1 Tax=Phakopsora pachyrhizi TaxID=170000 RepID=A0AAV0AW72_PHAPC|nr:hypothetical protein PPACK8108_LOCUS8938 [Phakopsora pachyrhizi]